MTWYICVFFLVIGYFGHCHGADLSGSPLIHGLTDKLTQAHPSFSRASIQDALHSALQLSLAAEGVRAEDAQCVRDYSGACPSGWADVGDGSSCKAPLGYTGACASSVSFGDLSPGEKADVAQGCGTSFPCVGDQEDFDAACPRSWTTDGSGDCVAPISYFSFGQCVGRKRFNAFTNSEKQSWGAICGVQWPSKSSASGSAELLKTSVKEHRAADYTQRCPENWAAEGNFCRASSVYQGPCSLRVNAGGWAAEAKKEFALRCGARWPSA